ncbi:sensor histidine kinase [Flaviaesturariibacter flavus]|nr:histidine kinase [Flaviaesturariibacter flavus]
MSQSIYKPLQARIFFGIGCWTVAQFQATIEWHSGLPLRMAIADAVISTALLATMVWLVACVFQYYLPARNRYGYLLALCSVLTAICLSAGYGLYQLVPGAATTKAFFTENLFWIRGAFIFLLIGCMALVSMLWYTLQDRQATERRRSEAEALSRTAELNNLRQQLQPHFLFNSLNSINTLIGIQPESARRMVLQLSEFLRGTLKQDPQQWVSLETELEHLSLYLEIEKVRFGHRLQTVVHNEAGDCMLPVLLLQPIVENAIKFGLYDTTGTITIDIRAERQDGVLALSVRNPFDPDTSGPRRGTGFGLSSVQRRLFLLFARPDLLQTEAQDGVFTTRIKIPQP